MTASLYQRRRSVDDSSLSACATARASLSSVNTEDVRRQGLRVELHVVAAAVPGVAAAAEQILEVVAAPLSQGEIDPAGLDVARIEVHSDEDQVSPFLLRVR